MLDTFAVQSEGVHLCLVQEALRDETYAEFYRKRSEAGDLIILDNGTFEQGHPCEDDEILKAMELVDADIVVAPDFPAESCSKTFEASAKFAERFVNASSADLMVVPQSQIGDIDDWLESMLAVLCKSERSRLGPLANFMDRVSMVGVTILSCPNAFKALVGDDEPEICRFTAFQFLRAALSGRTDIDETVRIHCLGAGSRLDLISYYSMAYSLDTSSPVWHGWHGINYSHGFLPQGKIKTPVNFQAGKPSEIYYGSIRRNINALKQAARRAEQRHPKTEGGQ
jgi:hypothetical protein